MYYKYLLIQLIGFIADLLQIINIFLN